MSVVDGALRGVVEVDPIYMSVEEKKQALLELSTSIDRLEELRMRVLAAAAAWLAHHERRDPPGVPARPPAGASLGGP